MRAALALLALLLLPVAAANPVEVDTECHSEGLRVIVSGGEAIVVGARANPVCAVVRVHPDELP